MLSKADPADLNADWQRLASPIPDHTEAGSSFLTANQLAGEGIAVVARNLGG